MAMQGGGTKENGGHVEMEGILTDEKENGYRVKEKGREEEGKGRERCKEEMERWGDGNKGHMKE